VKSGKGGKDSPGINKLCKNLRESAQVSGLMRKRKQGTSPALVQVFLFTSLFTVHRHCNCNILHLSTPQPLPPLESRYKLELAAVYG
jgi:hypothetical protein